MATDTIARVDPKTLVIAPNVRKNTKITKAFIASIQEHGVKVPIEVHDVGGALEVLDGQRRTLAAIDAGVADVPIVITAASEDASARIVDQLVMNEQREQLTRGERVHAVQELALIGVPAGEIAKRTSVDKKDIDKAIKVANSAPALAAVDEHEITLDQAAELVEFEGHPAVLKDLIERARADRQFDYAVREARTKIKLEASKKDLTAKLKRDGVPKVKETDLSHYGDSKPGSVLSRLTDEKGKEITPAAHKKCPGHSAYLSAGWGADKATIVYGCTDWEANGHKKVARGYVESEKDRKEREAREKKQALLEQARQISFDLRGEFVASLLQRDVAKLDGAIATIAEGIAGYPSTLSSGYYSNRDWRTVALGWLGVSVDEEQDEERLLAEQLDKPGAKHLTIAFAAALAMQEFYQDSFNTPALRIEYFKQLEAWGYQLTDFEKDAIAKAEADLAEQAERERQRAERGAAAAKATDAA